MTIEQILDCTFPRKFLVRFALACAKDVTHYIKDPEDLKLVLKCQETVSLWLDDKATIDEVKESKDNAYNITRDFYGNVATAYYTATAAAYAYAYAAAYIHTATDYATKASGKKAISHYY